MIGDAFHAGFPGSPVLLFFAFKFSQESRMLQKALVLVFVVASIAGCVGCGKTASHYVYATLPAANQVIAYREDPNSGVLTEISGSPYTVGDGAHSVVAPSFGKILVRGESRSARRRYFPVRHRQQRHIDRSDSTDIDWTERLAAGTPGDGPCRRYLYVANTRRTIFRFSRSIAALARSRRFRILHSQWGCHR